MSAEGMSSVPPGADNIGMTASGVGTLTFSTPVINPVLALVSWNSANGTFGGGTDTAS